MEALAPCIITWESISSRLHLDRRYLQRSLTQSVLGRLQPMALGRGLGTHRLFPLLAVPLLRQMRAPLPRKLDAWQAAVGDLLASPTWQGALDALLGLPRRSGDRMEHLLLSSEIAEPMARLQGELALVLDQYGLTNEFQMAPLIVDRIDEEDDAIILVGQDQTAYRLPRPLLELASIAEEQARGVLTATRTGAAVEVDAWPRAASIPTPAWQPDPVLLAMRADVGTPDWGRQSPADLEHSSRPQSRVDGE